MSTPQAIPARPAPSSLAVFNPSLFKGKVVFATGGGSGIGRVVVETLMRHGADAVIIGRKADRLQQAAKEIEQATGRQCLAAPADVRKLESVKGAAKAAIDKFGRIDFVICGAAGNFLAPLSALSENAFKTVLEIDTLGTFNTFKATIEHVRRTQGAYLHFSATLHYQGSVYQAHVSAAKAGVDALSNVIAIEEGPFGVRSNVLAPGPVGNTPGMDRLSSLEDPKARKIAMPLGRLGDTKDIANAVVFLFSEAAAHITGALLVVDGGAQHTYTGMGVFPYPQSVLDFESIKKLVPRL